MSHRVYHFDLPYTISHLQISFGMGELKSEGIFAELPADLQKRLTEAASSWTEGVTVTAADLDELSDKAWAAIATKLGLSWSPKAG